MEHVLTPRYKATQVSVEVLRDYVDVLYDVTIAYSDTWDPVTKKRKEAPSMIGNLDVQVIVTLQQTKPMSLKLISFET